MTVFNKKTITLVAYESITLIITASILFSALIYPREVAAQVVKNNPPYITDSYRAAHFFFGTSPDKDVGNLAWFFEIDPSRNIGEMYVAPRMLALNNIVLGVNGRVDFESSVLFGKKYKFSGIVKSDSISGEMQLININSDDHYYKWQLNGVLLRKGNPNLKGVLDARYSNNLYSREGGEETGVEIQFFPISNNKSSGMIVFYESYWGEPTLTSLSISQVIVKKLSIQFVVALRTGNAHYVLNMTPSGALFNRTDFSHPNNARGIILHKSKSLF